MGCGCGKRGKAFKKKLKAAKAKSQAANLPPAITSFDPSLYSEKDIQVLNKIQEHPQPGTKEFLAHTHRAQRAMMRDFRKAQRIMKAAGRAQRAREQEEQLELAKRLSDVDLRPPANFTKMAQGEQAIWIMEVEKRTEQAIKKIQEEEQQTAE